MSTNFYLNVTKFVLLRLSIYWQSTSWLSYGYTRRISYTHWHICRHPIRKCLFVLLFWSTQYFRVYSSCIILYNPIKLGILHFSYSNMRRKKMITCLIYFSVSNWNAIFCSIFFHLFYIFLISMFVCYIYIEYIHDNIVPDRNKFLNFRSAFLEEKKN